MSKSAAARTARNKTHATNGPVAGQEMAFAATLEAWAEGMDYCAVPVPARITAALGTHGPVLVMAQVNDSRPFQVSLFPTGGGQHYLRIKAAVRQATKTKTGDRINVRFTVLNRSVVTIPKDFEQALRAHNRLDVFKALPPGRQNFTIRQINEAKKADARARRIARAVESSETARPKDSAPSVEVGVPQGRPSR